MSLIVLLRHRHDRGVTDLRALSQEPRHGRRSAALFTDIDGTLWQSERKKAH